LIFFLEYIEVRFAKDPEVKKEKLEAWLKKFDNFLPNIDRILKKNGGKFFTGNEVTTFKAAFVKNSDFHTLSKLII
jgi:hypothetical protein